MNRNRITLEELVRLYEEEGLSLAEVARRIGGTRQGVHYQLVKAGVRMRPMGAEPARSPRFEREMMVDLYVRQRLPIVQIAARLGLTAGIITYELKKHGIERRPRGSRLRKYPDLSQLQIGESVLVPRPGHKRPYP